MRINRIPSSRTEEEAGRKLGLFDDGFVEGLPEDVLHAGLSICRAFKEFHELNTPEETEKEYRKYLYAFGLFKSYAAQYNQAYEFPELREGVRANIAQIVNFFQTARTWIEHAIHVRDTRMVIQEVERALSVRFKRSLAYRLSGEELDRIKTLLVELRELFTNEPRLDPQRKLRLLRRLDRIGADLAPRMPDFDLFWGLFVDTGIDFGQSPEDSRAVLARVRELFQIVWASKLSSEGLPNDTELRVPPPETPSAT
ncbi:MAG: hypothetical protein GHCLOJNM_03477 [bacterium]|nr:hypothetical protein [bacterium]